MYLSVCGDPDCPNKQQVEELKAEVERLKRELAAARRSLEYMEEDRAYVRPKFRYPD